MWAELKLQVITVAPQGSVISATEDFSIMPSFTQTSVPPAKHNEPEAHSGACNFFNGAYL